MKEKATSACPVSTFLGPDNQFDTQAFAQFKYHHLRAVVRSLLTSRNIGEDFQVNMVEMVALPFIQQRIEEIAWAEHQPRYIPYRDLPFGIT